MQTIIRLHNCFLYYASAISPAMMLVLRLWMAKIFWASGILKVSDWQNTIALFTHEHPVPFLPVPLAAFMGTAFEIICPILLLTGFMTRAATLPLIVMTLVINFTYQETTEHYYWLMMLGVILTQGAGKLSADHWLRQRYAKQYKLS
jgi:putative oxidoreductase